MRRLRAAHDEGKGGEAMEQGPQRQHGGEGWEEERGWAACPFSGGGRSGAGRAAATTQGEEDERSPRPPPPQESPRLPLLPGPGYYPEQQQQQLADDGGRSGEAQEEGGGDDPSVVIMDPEPLPRPPLHLGRRCLLPTRLQPGAPVQAQRALHSAATGRRYLFLRCLVKEKPRVMIMLAAVLRPVPTGSAQVGRRFVFALFTCT